MIACRCFFRSRVDGVLKLSNSCNALKPVGYFQEYRTYHGLNYKVKMAGGKDQQSKRLKAVNRVWRPVSTQATSYEECSSKDVEVESGAEIRVQETNSSTSTTASNARNVTELSEAVIEITDAITSSGGLDGNGEDIVLKEQSVVSTETHSISVEVGASLIRFIKGKGGSTQKQIEDEMGVNIVFPTSEEEDSVIIEGVSMDSVTKASARIQTIIDQAVKSPSLDYSHFISLPLAIHPELVDKLVMFQNSILGSGDPRIEDNVDGDSNEDCAENEDEDQNLDRGPSVAGKLKVDDDKEGVRKNITNVPFVSYAPKAAKSSNLSDMGIEKSIFINPKTFHLTVLMLMLWNKERVDAAAQVLQSISSQVIDALDNRPVSIKLRGLDCMKGSLAKARVVYLPVEEIGGEGRLLRACQIIIDAFVKAGLVLEKDANHSLKLHATVMNARHRKRTKWGRIADSFDARGRIADSFDARGRIADSFDARSIFKQYGSEEWGEYAIREAHLSQRFAYDENGYYHRCASIPFPVNMQAD